MQKYEITRCVDGMARTWPLTCWDRVISVWLGQYHGCWCPGSLRCQDISSHDIDYVEYVGTGLTWGRILSICVILMWSNDMKCEYIFMFPLQNLAHKGLSHPMQSLPGTPTHPSIVTQRSSSLSWMINSHPTTEIGLFHNRNQWYSKFINRIWTILYIIFHWLTRATLNREIPSGA